MEDSPPSSDRPTDAQTAGAERRRAERLVGRVFSGRYRIDELLAVGGMGAVYRGTHLLLRKRIAIKVLLPGLGEMPELVTRFQREAIAGAHVQHPNVAAATDFGALDDGGHFLVLEFLRGTTLSHELKIGGAFTPERALHVARQIALALAAVHRIGIVHRDVKPRNTMLLGGRGDVAKLIDFGLAKIATDRISTLADRRSFAGERASRADEARITGVGTIIGTVGYLAPEAALGMEAIDARSDLYALGVILYEMLSGVHLFPGTDAVEIFTQHCTTPPLPIAERVPGLCVPEALEAVARRLLEKAPEARYQTSEEVIAALDAARTAPAQPRSAAPPAELSTDELPPGLRPRGWALGAGALFLAGIGLGALTLLRFDDSPPQAALSATTEATAPSPPPPPLPDPLPTASASFAPAADAGAPRLHLPPARAGAWLFSAPDAGARPPSSPARAAPSGSARRWDPPAP